MFRPAGQERRAGLGLDERVQPRRTEERRANRHASYRLADHQHRVGLTDLPALLGELLNERRPQLSIRAGQQAAIKPPAEEPAAHPAALRAPPPQGGQNRVRITRSRSYGDRHLDWRDALLRQEDRDLVCGVLPGDRRGDLPDDEVAELTTIVLGGIRKRLGDHLAARTVLPGDSECEVPQVLHIPVRIRRWLALPEVAPHPKREKAQVAGGTEFLDKPVRNLLVRRRRPVDLLHELQAAHALYRPAMVGIALDTVDCPQDLDVVPSEGHPRLPPSRQPPLTPSPLLCQQC